MVDMMIYKQMHPNTAIASAPEQDDLGPDIMIQDKPPVEDSFYMSLPSKILGFNMHKKEWGENDTILQASGAVIDIREQWNWKSPTCTT
jgi:hypothetical protein